MTRPADQYTTEPDGLVADLASSRPSWDGGSVDASTLDVTAEKYAEALTVILCLEADIEEERAAGKATAEDIGREAAKIKRALGRIAKATAS
jgi:hypothetical protein